MDPLKIPTSSPTEENAPVSSVDQASPADKGADAASASQEVATNVLPGSTPESPVAAPISTEPVAPEASAPSPLGEASAVTPGVISPMDVPAAAMGAAPVVAPSKGSRKKVMIIAGIIVGVLLLLSGGAAAAYYRVLNKPENILGMALGNTLNNPDIKTAQFSGVLETESKDSGDVPFSATYEGAVNTTSGAFDLTAKLGVLGSKITLDARTADGATYYVRVGGLRSIIDFLSLQSVSSFASPYVPILDIVNDQWVEIDNSLIKQFSGGTVKGDKFTEADRAKLFEAYKQHRFIVVKKVLADEAIKGANSYHYQIGADKAVLKAFVQALSDSGSKTFKMTPDQLKEIKQAIDGADLDKAGVEVWIAKDTKRINQAQLTFSEDGDTGTLRLTLDSFNKPLNVEKPEGAKSLLDIISAYYTQALGGGLGTDYQSLLSDMPSNGISL